MRMDSSAFRRVAAGLALAAALAGLFAGPRARAQEPPAGTLLIPPTETALVEVAVVVTDAQGRPVTGLKPEDFVLLEDEKPQQVRHFVPGIATATAAAAGAAADAPAPAAGAVTALPTAPSSRHIVLAVDDLHISSAGLIATKEALNRFIGAQVADDDEVALVTTSGSLGLFQAFTKDRRILRRAVDRLSHQARPTEAGALMTTHQAQSIERGDPEALGLAATDFKLRDLVSQPPQAEAAVNPRYQPEARSQARNILGQALETSALTMRTLEGVLRGLAPVSGRKVVVLVSDGFVVGQGTSDPRVDVRRLIDASARAGVAIYALDSQGVVGGVTGGDASQAARGADAEKPGVREALKQRGMVAQREGMSNLAEGTGGFLVHGSNDLAVGFERILQDSDASYLMGYEPASDVRDGRFRQIAVRLPNHTGLMVRARKGYFAPDDRPGRGSKDKPAAASAAKDARRVQEIRTAVASLVPLRGLPIRMSADFLDTPPAGPQLVLTAHVDLGTLRPVRASAGQKADVEVMGVVFDEKGQVVGELKGQRVQFDLAAAASETVLKEGLRYKSSSALKPGLYQVRVVARDGTSSQLGSASDWVEIPEGGRGQLSLSSLFLFAGTKTPPSPAPDAKGALDGLKDVQVLRRFGKGESLYFFVYAYNPARDDSGAADVVLQSQVWSGTKLQGVSPVQPVAFGARDAPPQQVSGLVDLEGLAPGDYELRILVRDRRANTNALRRIGFTVE